MAEFIGNHPTVYCRDGACPVQGCEGAQFVGRQPIVYSRGGACPAQEASSERVVRGSAPPQGDRKGPIPSSSPHPPLQRLRRGNWLFRVFVRAGAAWSGVGTLAVALG